MIVSLSYSRFVHTDSCRINVFLNHQGFIYHRDHGCRPLRKREVGVVSRSGKLQRKAMSIP